MMRAALAAVAATLMVAPSAADEFCDVIVRVASDAGNGFANVRGVSHHPSGKRYDEVPTPPGTFPERIIRNIEDPPPDKDTPQPCSIFPVSTDAPPWRYVCEFPTPTYHKGAPDAAVIARHVVSCLTEAHEKLATENPPPGEFFRATMDDAIITIGIDFPSDAGEPRYYMFIDQKAH